MKKISETEIKTLFEYMEPDTRNVYPEHVYENFEVTKNLIANNAEMNELLKIAKCPMCDGGGAYHGHDGEPIQCQWCDEVSKYKDN